MRFLTLLFVVPLLAQDGQIDMRVLQNAMRDTFLKSVKNSPARKPLTVFRNRPIKIMGVRPIVCPAPLPQVPTPNVDPGMVKPAVQADKMKVYDPCR